jgi:hypothetical protein
MTTRRSAGSGDGVRSGRGWGRHVERVRDESFQWLRSLRLQKVWCRPIQPHSTHVMHIMSSPPRGVSRQARQSTPAPSPGWAPKLACLFRISTEGFRSVTATP